MTVKPSSFGACQVLTAWAVAFALEVGLHAALPAGLLRTARIDGASMLSALAVEAFLLGAAAFVTLGPAAVLGASRQRSGVALLCVSVVFWAYLLFSWGTFRQTGEFPSETTSQFLWSSGVQVMQHALEQAPLATVATVVGVGVLGLGVPVLATRFTRFGSSSGRLLALLFAVTAAVASTGHAISRDSTALMTAQARTTRGEWFEYHRRYHTGPFASLAYQLPSSTLYSNLSDVRTPLEFERPPREPLADWASRAKPSSRLNVIVILIESMRADILDRMGQSQSIMPNMERIAQQSLRMVNAYTMASHSDAADPCPLSGQGPIRQPRGVVTYQSDPPYPRVLIYDLLHHLGYRTAIISSQNETWGGMLNFLDTGNLDLILHSETYQGPTYVPDNDPTFKRFLAGKKKAGKIDDRFTVGEAIRWIDEGGEKPFFIYMNLQNSHVPYRRPADYPARFAQPGDAITATISELDADEVEPAKRLYWDSLHYVDAQLGRLFAHLEATGRMDDTLLVVSGDTGQGFMEHGFFTHARDLYNEVMRVPLLLHGPGIQAGTDDRLAAHIDVPPTILRRLGLPPHPSFHGFDLTNPEIPASRSVFLSVNSFTYQQAIVKDGYKLIYDLRRDRALLFDLELDPGETTNIAGEKPALFRDLLGRVNSFRDATIDYYKSPERMAKEFPPVLETSR